MTVPIVAAGLVASNTASATYGAVMVRRHIGSLGGAVIWDSWGRLLGASLGAALVAWPVAAGATKILPDSRFGSLGVVLLGAVFYGLAYVLLVYVVQVREVTAILQTAARRFPRLGRLVD
jgi:hypothetical protein